MQTSPASSRLRRPGTIFVLVVFVFVATTGWLVFDRHLADLATLGMPTMQPRFVDARIVSCAGVALEQGLDPMVSNPGDPLARPLNYPRVWLLLSRWGVDERDTTMLALAFFLAFVLGVASLARIASSRGAVLVLAVSLFSPVVWLAVERGNNDLLMFGLVAAATGLVVRWPVVASWVIGLAAVLKLYPVFALLACVVGTPRRAARAIVPVLLLFIGYLWWTRADLWLIEANTYHWNRISYGVDLLPAAISKHVGWRFVPVLVGAVVLLLLTLGASMMARLRLRLVSPGSPHALAAFRAGAAVFLCTFCIANHFDYRLIFLLLTLPQLVAWARSTRGLVRWAFAGLMMLIPLVLWSMTWRMWLRRGLGSEGVGLAIDEILCWLLALGMISAVVLSMPDWLLPAARRGARCLDGEAGEAAILVGGERGSVPRQRQVSPTKNSA